MSAAAPSDFLRILTERGFIHQSTDQNGLKALMDKGPITAYIGFDCTGPSLHVGSLIQIMMLRWLQKTGNRPIVLLGGGTSMIGDPSGKDESRKMLTPEKITENKAGIGKIFSRFLNDENKAGASIFQDAAYVDNADWLSGLGYIDFLRNYGPHFTVNRMMTFDSVKLRLEREQPLTFLEFNYMILQAYDFLELNRRENCVLQMGGSDQWGNIVNGMELIRRVDAKPSFGLTTALITTADGKKMGKTENGAIWLNEDQLSSYDYWQFWRNTQDRDVGRFLKLFTELPLDEIRRLEALEGSEINDAKIILADEATRLCRGLNAARSARQTAEDTFLKGGAGEDLPTYTITAAELAEGVGILDIYSRCGLAKSNGEARRLIKQGGAKIDDKQVTDDGFLFTSETFACQQTIKLSAGKKRHALLNLD